MRNDQAIVLSVVLFILVCWGMFNVVSCKRKQHVNDMGDFVTKTECINDTSKRSEKLKFIQDCMESTSNVEKCNTVAEAQFCKHTIYVYESGGSHHWDFTPMNYDYKIDCDFFKSSSFRTSDYQAKRNACIRDGWK